MKTNQSEEDRLLGEINMSNNETGFIKFLTLLLVLGLISGFTGCETSTHLNFNQAEHDEIIGGKNVKISSQFSKKVIYLSLGVERTKTNSGTSLKTQGLCSASAISKRILLTAAHCVDKWEPSEVNAVLSLNPFKKGSFNEKDWIKVEKIKIHENYRTTPTVENDFALIRLAKDLDDDRISKLATSDQNYENMELVTIGYGRTQVSGSDRSSESAESILYYLLKPFEFFEINDPTIIINQTDETGICSGDSGSPGFIFNKKTKEFIILGVASYVTHPENTSTESNVAEPCHGYGIYMNVLTHREWITKNAIGLN